MRECSQWLDSLPTPSGVLERVQIQGRESLIKLGIPTRKIEKWRLTDLDKLTNQLKLPIQSKQSKLHSNSYETWPNKGTNSIRIVIDNLNNPFKEMNLPNGFKELSEAELKKALGQTLDKCCSNNEWHIAVNQASAKQVIGLKIDGTHLPSLELILPGAEETFTPTRVIIILENKAKLNLLQVALGSKFSAQNHLVEIHLGKDAELNHGWVGLGAEDSSLMAHIAVKQESRSNYSLTCIQQGWLFTRIEPRIVQIEGHAKTTVRGLQISNKKEQVATHSVVRFDGPEGSLDQLQKSVADDQSHCIFNGGIEVPRVAQQTNAAQLSRNLLMSNRARIDTKPELEIIADDVRCAHGATVSQLQQDELFYLRSRGIKSTQATSLLLQGYCQDILQSLPIEGKKWNILNKLLTSIKKDDYN